MSEFFLFGFGQYQIVPLQIGLSRAEWNHAESALSLSLSLTQNENIFVHHTYFLANDCKLEWETIIVVRVYYYCYY